MLMSMLIVSTNANALGKYGCDRGKCFKGCVTPLDKTSNRHCYASSIAFHVANTCNKDSDCARLKYCVGGIGGCFTLA